MKVNKPDKTVSVVHYWCGCPSTPNSKWRRFLHLISACADRNWRNTLVWTAMPSDESLWKPFVDVGCDIVLQPKPKKNFDLSCIWRTYRMLRSLQCDVFHCHNVHTSPLIGATLAGVKARLWSNLAMPEHYENGTDPTGIHRLVPSYRVSCALAHRILTVSNAIQSEMVQLGVPSCKMMVTPGPIDLDVFRNVMPDGVRNELHLDDSNLLFLSIGYAIPVKGWDLLIEAFSRVAQTVCHARLILVGSTNSTPEEVRFMAALRKRIDELNITDKVIFAGERNDVPRLLAAADVFVLPSRSEGHPNALKEAMACRRPCVATSTGGIPEIIQHRHNGLLVDRDNVNQLADSMIELANDPALRDALAAKAGSFVEQFDLDSSTDEMMNIYDSLLDNDKAIHTG